MRVYRQFSYDFMEKTESFGKDVMNSDGWHWVYDKKHDVLCVVEMGAHASAVIFLIRKYYGVRRINRNDISKLQQVIGDNMIFYNAKVHDPEHYALRSLIIFLRNFNCNQLVVVLIDVEGRQIRK